MVALRFYFMLKIYQRNQKIKVYGGFKVLFYVKNLPEKPEN